MGRPLATARPRTARPRTARPRTAPRRRASPAKIQAADDIVGRLRAAYPDADCKLRWESPLQLLVATILSAQCTDVRVNQVTRLLFIKYQTPEDYLEVPAEELERDIQPTGFFRNKARHIKGACRLLLEKFQGDVPRTMDEMLALPGVARKTANVVLGTAYGIGCGVVVDTHVRRVAFRLGWTKHDDPVKIEADLMRLIRPDSWIYVAHALIRHGRRICHSRRPRCELCMLRDLCPRRGVRAVLTKGAAKLRGRRKPAAA